jgi:dTMP kinase
MSETLSRTVPGGLVVFFEGIDGVGKTTQLGLAYESLSADGWSLATTRAHGGTDIGEALRDVSLSDIPRPVETDFHISLAIHEALARKIDEYCEKGRIVLVDRGPLSIAAYQIYGDGMDRDTGWEAIEHDLNIFGPETNIIYTAAVSVALDRARKLSRSRVDYFESKPNEYFDLAQQGYMDAAERFGATVIDAELPIDSVHLQTMSVIQNAIGKKLRKQA